MQFSPAVPHVVPPLTLVALSLAEELCALSLALSSVPVADVEVAVVIVALAVAVAEVLFPVAFVFVVVTFFLVGTYILAITLSQVTPNLAFVIVISIMLYYLHIYLLGGNGWRLICLLF